MVLVVGLYKRIILWLGKVNKIWKCGKIWFIIIYGVVYEWESIEFV